MTVPTVQPASAAEKYFEYNYTLTGDTGSWDAAVTAVEGTEGLVSDTVNAALTVGNFITLSYAVDNQDGGKTQTAEPGDTLVYTITIDNTGSATPISIDQAILGCGEPGETWAPSGAINASTDTNIEIDFVVPNGRR